MLATEIRLMPDWTVAVQLFIFLLTMAVLYIFVFRPALKIMDRRRSFTEDAKAMAERLSSEAEGLERGRERKISETIAGAASDRSLAMAKANREADRIITEARIEAKRLIDSTEVSVEISEDRVSAEMARQAELISKQVVAKVLGES